jgi:hypothetical protein
LIDVKKQSSCRQKERNTLFLIFRRYCIDIPNMQDVDLWRMQIILPCWMNMKTRHLFTTNLTIYRYRVARNYYLWKNIARWLYISIISSRTFQSTYQDRVRFNPPIINLIKASITWYIQEGVKEIVICEEGWSLFFF